MAIILCLKIIQLLNLGGFRELVSEKFNKHTQRENDPFHISYPNNIPVLST